MLAGLHLGSQVASCVGVYVVFAVAFSLVDAAL
jgi:hypothetical protein